LSFHGSAYVAFKADFEQNVSTYFQTLFKYVCPRPAGRHYYRKVNSLILNPASTVALDPDAELPDWLMPKAYVEYWLDKGDQTNNE
jgi:hypothetical protein